MGPMTNRGDACTPLEERWTVADEAFAAFLKQVSRKGYRRAVALREARPGPWDAHLEAEKTYDAETEQKRRFIRGQDLRETRTA